jgi:tripartite-type tricarboxylate transporter receptor subunit TctC
MRITRRALAATIGGLPIAARAQQGTANWPTRPIRIVVGYPPGGTTDILARLLAERLHPALGQPVVVENRSGAAGNIGAEAVAKSPPDGHTLQMGTAGNMTINPSVYANMPVDTVRDFQAISMVAQVPNVMVVHPSVPARTVREFIDWAKARPGQVFFGSSGTGNSPHLSGELFAQQAGLQLVHVPYRGSGPALAALVAAQGVQVMWDNLPSAIGHIRDGRLRALAVTGPQRAVALPDLPTMREAGLPDYEVVAWFGLFAPAGTPRPIVDRLHRETVAALRTAEMRERIIQLGAEPVGNTPEEFAAIVVRDIEKWRPVVRAAGVRVE